jgi:Putative prokaryotic signal transducing protein
MGCSKGGGRKVAPVCYVSQAGINFEGVDLRELIRANDAVLLSAVSALLDGAGIDYLVLDQNMSVIEGSLGILPRRILVGDDDATQARQLMKDAGLAHELRSDE